MCERLAYCVLLCRNPYAWIELEKTPWEAAVRLLAWWLSSLLLLCDSWALNWVTRLGSKPPYPLGHLDSPTYLGLKPSHFHSFSSIFTNIFFLSFLKQGLKKKRDRTLLCSLSWPGMQHPLACLPSAGISYTPYVLICGSVLSKGIDRNNTSVCL